MPDHTSDRSPRPGVNTVAVPPAVAAATAAAGHIARMWRENPAGGILHIVFHDPVPDDGPDPHGKLRDQLAGSGVPRSAIMIAGEAGPGREAQLIRDCRGGGVGVLIASSSHDRLVRLAAQGRRLVIHHLDVPRSYPAASRRAQVASAGSGRATEPVIFRYVTSGAPSGWESLDRKQAIIDQLTDGPAGVPVSFSELKAAAVSPLAGFRPTEATLRDGTQEPPGSRRPKRAGNPDRPGRSRRP